MNKKRKKWSDWIITAVIVVLSTMFFIAFAYPVVYVLVSSVCTASMRDGLSLIPNRILLDGYRALFEDKTILRGTWNSILYTSVGTLISMTLTVSTAYVLSCPQFRSGKLVSFLLIFTLYFSGGLIPTYLLVKNLGLVNTMWALILPSCISVYNVSLTKSYFANKIPVDLYDAARMDGCGEFRFLRRVVLPLASSFLYVIMLFYVVSYWNSYFNAMIFITDLEKLPLANILNNILIKNQSTSLETGVLYANMGVDVVQARQLLEYALIVFSTFPMIMLFALVKKHMKEEDLSVGVKL